MELEPGKIGGMRGMAIKIMGTAGKRVAYEQAGPTNLDLILTDTPVYPHKDLNDYIDFLEHALDDKLDSWFFNVFPFRWRYKELSIAKNIANSSIENPLNNQYFSVLPYQLGLNNVKFSAKTCPKSKIINKFDTKNKNYLLTNLQTTLDTESACFDFFIQPQRNSNQLIDDARVEWDEETSPPVTVAKILISPQQLNSPDQHRFCENLSMNPWRGVGAWQPLGSLNLARRFIYQAISDFRHENNRSPKIEPRGWCLNGSTQCLSDGSEIRN